MKKRVPKYTYLFYSNARVRCVFNLTNSDPYDEERVKSYDQMLHRTLHEIFRERRLTRDQLRKLLSIKRCTDETSIMHELIVEREPAFGELFPAKNVLSLLWIAALSCYQDSAELLVRSGADLNELCGSNGEFKFKLNKKSTLLHALLAMYPSSWNERFCALLIEHGADLEARDSYGSTVLLTAVENGRVKIAEMLLVKGAKVNVAECFGYTPLLAAASGKKADELLPLLMRHGADINARDDCGRNALYHLGISALDMENVDLARVLIEKGVSVSEIASDQSQPIHQAVERGKVGLVNLFLDHGVDVNVRGSENKIPLYIAARECENPAMLLTLLKRGADIDRKVYDETALYSLIYGQCCRWRDKNIAEMIKLLLSVGADTFAENNQGLTPLDAVCCEYVEHGYALILLKALALRMACQRRSIEFKYERIIKKDPELWNRYRNCVDEIDTLKATAFIETCTLFELLTKCQCQIAALMRNREFDRKFRLCDLGFFPMFAEDILEAFERAEHYYHTVLEQVNLINEAVYNILPHIVVRKVVDYIINKCEICELKKIVQASRGK